MPSPVRHSQGRSPPHFSIDPVKPDQRKSDGTDAGADSLASQGQGRPRFATVECFRKGLNERVRLPTVGRTVPTRRKVVSRLATGFFAVDHGFCAKDRHKTRDHSARCDTDRVVLRIGAPLGERGAWTPGSFCIVIPMCSSSLHSIINFRSSPQRGEQSTNTGLCPTL